MPRKRKEKIIILDFDDTISAFLSALCSLHNSFYGTSVTANDIKEWNFDSLNFTDMNGKTVKGKELRKTFLDYEDGIYGVMKPFHNSIQALEQIRSLGYKIFIMTARKKMFERQTDVNIRANGIPCDQLMFIKDKARKIKELQEKYDVVVFADDKASTCESVKKKCDVDNVFIVNQAHNIDSELKEEVVRVTSLMEIVRHLPAVNQ